MTCENGKFGGSADMGGIRAWDQAVSEPTGPPGGEHPAVLRGGPVLGPGAERSAGGRLGGRGAAGRRNLKTGPEVIYLDGARSAHYSDDGGLCTAVVSGYHMCRADIWHGSC